MNKSLFDKVHIEITNICNLQCSFCPKVLRTKKIMDLELFSKIVREVAPLTQQIALHLMGDPMLHPKLKDFLNICGSNNLKVFLVTNGTLLKEKHLLTLLHPTIRQVNFSLHSFSDNFPEKDFSDYLKGIFEFTDQALNLRPDLYINYRLWNLKSINSQKNSNFEMLNAIRDKYNFSIPDEIYVKNKKSFKVVGRLYLHFDTEFVWPSLELPFLGTQGTCYGLRSHFGILVDGTVVPCCLDKEGLIPLGNINNSSLDQILSDEKAQNILKGFLVGFLANPLCQRCQYKQRFKLPKTIKNDGHIVLK
jgi:radical SAM protein with 4Fe4S-binding SPASM domain